jgi:hypothetical protein
MRFLALVSITLAAAIVAGSSAEAAQAPIQKANGIVCGPLAASSRYIVFVRSNGLDDDDTVTVEERDLLTAKTRRLAATSLPSLGVGSTSRWAVFAVPGATQALLVAVPHGGGRRLVLSRSLIAPVASHGERIAWAEGDATRERVIVRNMATGRNSVAADLPRCLGGDCYRIDDVTLADEGVVFSRGAVGPQPSVVMRRRFGGPLEETAVPNDPQPDLIPSFAGAYYYAYARGWRRWDFGGTRPRAVPGPPAAAGEALALDRKGLLVQGGDTCHPTLVFRAGGAPETFAAPRPQGAKPFGHLCSIVTGFSLQPDRLVVGWALLPEVSLQSHSDVGLVGFLTVNQLDH